MLQLEVEGHNPLNTGCSNDGKVLGLGESTDSWPLDLRQYYFIPFLVKLVNKHELFHQMHLNSKANILCSAITCLQ